MNLPLENYYVVSFSGGKDSTAMLLKLVHEGYPIHEVIFCDTGKEFDEIYEHVEYVQSLINMPITILKGDKSFEYWLYEHVKVKGKTKGEIGYGWPSMMIRWCTRALKVQVINRHLRKLKKQGYNIIQYIGIAHDEKKRVKNEPDKIYPLVNWKMSEQDCLDYCKENGCTWGGLYDIFWRTGCWCCPLQSLGDLKTLRKYFPDKWEYLKQMDKKSIEITGSCFRRDYSVEELERKFDAEEYMDKNQHTIFNMSKGVKK